MHHRLAGRRLRRALRVGAAFTLLLVVLPNVLYLGHSGQHADLHDAAQAEEHAAHCHLGPSKCGSQYSLVSASWADGDVWRFKPAGILFAAEGPSRPSPSEGPSFKFSPPPRYP